MRWNGSDLVRRRVRNSSRNTTKKVRRLDSASNSRRSELVSTRTRLATERYAIRGITETHGIIVTEETIVSRSLSSDFFIAECRDVADTAYHALAI